MVKENFSGLVRLSAEGTNKITNSKREFYSDYIYMGKDDSEINYEEVPYDVWKNFIEVENPKIEIINEKVKELQNTQSSQDEEIVINMVATSDLFEMVLGLVQPMIIPNREIETEDNKEGGINMVELYVTLIMKGKKTIDDVPNVIREQVKERLKELGYKDEEL